MEALDKLLKRKKVTKTTTTVVEEEEEEIQIDDEQLKQSVISELMELDNRVRMLEMELELYEGSNS